MSDYDVIVVGGGVAGASAALGLGQRGYSVCLMDGRERPRFDPSQPPGLRVSTFSLASVNILAGLGCWEAIEAVRAAPFRRMRVWENDARQELAFDARDAGLPALGYVVENALVDWALWESLDAHAHVTLLPQTRLHELRNGARQVRVTTENGQRLSASLVIGADGGDSRVRTSVGIETRHWDYRQHGLVCTVALDADHDATAWQRFLAGGPLAFLPMAQPRTCSIVWSLPQPDAQVLCDCDRGEFEERLTQAMQRRLGRVACISERVSFPLRRLRAQRYFSQRVALLGDAAHVVHPLAGQGANLGLLDAAALIELVSAGSGQGIDAPGVLRRYERWRRADNELVATAMHGLRWFYAQQLAPVVGLRLFGAGLLTRLAPVKARLIAHASGFGGRVPQLALSEQMRVDGTAAAFGLHG